MEERAILQRRPPGFTPGVDIVARAIPPPAEWWDSPLETAATDGADGLSLHEPEVTLRLPVLTVFPVSLLLRRETRVDRGRRR